jgi:hypothetical protein
MRRISAVSAGGTSVPGYKIQLALSTAEGHENSFDILDVLGLGAHMRFTGSRMSDGGSQWPYSIPCSSWLPEHQARGLRIGLVAKYIQYMRCPVEGSLMVIS